MSTFSFIRGQLVKLVKAFFRGLGLQIGRIPPPITLLHERPVGSMAGLLEEIKLRHFDPGSILDVGAHRADWSRMAARNFPNASFVLIEPQQEMTVHLEEFCRDFPKARYVLAGAGAAEGELILTLEDDPQGSSFLREENGSIPVDRSRRVKIITIDSLYDDEADLPRLVKLDIQGFELEALKGARKLLGRTDLFILEVSLFEFLPRQPVFSEVVGFMAQAGYEVYDFPGFLRRPFDGAVGQVDIAFARRDGLLRRSRAW